MILAGLVSLGVEPEKLVKELKRLNISDFGIEFSQVNRAGIASIHARTKFPEEKKHRHLSDIEKIIVNSELADKIKQRAFAIFENLARAEAKVHGMGVEKVHFHEVGAMDAILDVVGACIGFEILEIEHFACSKIHVGSGFVQMEHGNFPVPPPAVTELLTGVPVYSTEVTGELITPTGAAIISTVCRDFGYLPEMSVEKTGYGAGTREYADFPNVLRLIMGKVEEEKTEKENQRGFPEKIDSKLQLLETNIDDLTPQILGFVMDRAFELGALDCWFTPIQMKKNRPATLISILCENEKKEELMNLLYTETSTLGIRLSEVKRDCLEREIRRVQTEFGEFDVKLAKFNGKIVNAKPEYDQIRDFAVKSKIPLRELEQKILKDLKIN